MRGWPTGETRLRDRPAWPCRPPDGPGPGRARAKLRPPQCCEHGGPPARARPGARTALANDAAGGLREAKLTPDTGRDEPLVADEEDQGLRARTGAGHRQPRRGGARERAQDRREEPLVEHRRALGRSRPPPRRLEGPEARAHRHPSPSRSRSPRRSPNKAAGAEGARAAARAGTPPTPRPAPAVVRARAAPHRVVRSTGGSPAAPANPTRTTRAPPPLRGGPTPKPPGRAPRRPAAPGRTGRRVRPPPVGGATPAPPPPRPRSPTGKPSRRRPAQRLASAAPGGPHRCAARGGGPRRWRAGGPGGWWRRLPGAGAVAVRRRRSGGAAMARASRWWSGGRGGPGGGPGRGGPGGGPGRRAGPVVRPRGGARSGVVATSRSLEPAAQRSRRLDAPVPRARSWCRAASRSRSSRPS